MIGASEGTVDVRLDTLEELALARAAWNRSSRIDRCRIRPPPMPGACSWRAHLMWGSCPRQPRPGGAHRAFCAAGDAREHCGRGGTRLILAASCGRPRGYGPRHRRNARRLRRGCGGEWALSGAAALAALGSDAAQRADDFVQVLWTPDPGRALQHLVGLGANVASPAVASVILCEPSDLTLRGSASRGGVRIVAPAQAIIDNLGLPEPQRSEAARDSSPAGARAIAQAHPGVTVGGRTEARVESR